MQRRRPRPTPITEAKSGLDWTKLLTAAGGLVGAIAALLTALHGMGVFERQQPDPTPTTAGTSALAVGHSPAVSATETRSPTAHPTETPQQQGILLEDNFSDPASGWGSSAAADSETGYSEGEYRVAVNATEMVVWENTRGHHWDDVLVLVDARRTAGPLDNQYGLLVRYVDRANFYAFWVSSDGMYAVQKLSNDDWIDLVEWSESSVIRQGDLTNVLRVECKGSQMRFFVNDELLTTIHDDAFRSGDVGLAAASFGETGVVIHFDNLLVRSLND